MEVIFLKIKESFTLADKDLIQVIRLHVNSWTKGIYGSFYSLKYIHVELQGEPRLYFMSF